MFEDVFTDNFDGYIFEDVFTDDFDGGVWFYFGRVYYIYFFFILVFIIIMNVEGFFCYRIINISVSMLINFLICIYIKEDIGCFDNIIYFFFFCRKI